MGVLAILMKGFLVMYFGLHYEYSRQSFYEKVFSIRVTGYHIDGFTKWISICIYICKTESVCLG